MSLTTNVGGTGRYLKVADVCILATNSLPDVIFWGLRVFVILNHKSDPPEYREAYCVAAIIPPPDWRDKTPIQRTPPVPRDPVPASGGGKETGGTTMSGSMTQEEWESSNFNNGEAERLANVPRPTIVQDAEVMVRRILEHCGQPASDQLVRETAEKVVSNIKATLAARPRRNMRA